MEFLSDYGLFLAKTLTLLLSFVVVLVLIALSRRQGEHKPRGHLRVINLGEELKTLKHSVRQAVFDKEFFKAEQKAEKASAKAEAKAAKQRKSAPVEPGARCYVLNFHGDLRASAVECLREEVTAVLAVAEPRDAILVRLESPGGMVHAYGLAASQLKRLRERGLKLTVAVDKVAASGGYMMACVAEHIVAAPFAVLGSIGVVAQIPNVHRLLKKHDIDVELHTAGEYKRTLTVLGENTDKAREKFKAELEETHELFKQFVGEHRPGLELARVTTGEHWYGTQAKTLGLVDEVRTSDDLLLEYADRGPVFELRFVPHKSLAERLAFHVEEGLAKAADRWLARGLQRPEV